MARKIRVNFSCHCLKFTIVFLSNQLNKGKKIPRELFLSLFKVYHCFFNQLNNGKKNSRELFLSLFKVYHCFFKQSIKQWQEKFRVNFSCHCLKFTIVFLSNQLNNGKKNSRELFLPLFKVYHCFLSNQLNNGKKNSRELFLPLFKVYHCFFKQSIKQWQKKIRVNFSCHCLKFTIVFLSNQLNNGKKNSRELFLPLFKVYHCFLSN